MISRGVTVRLVLKQEPDQVRLTMGVGFVENVLQMGFHGCQRDRQGFGYRFGVAALGDKDGNLGFTYGQTVEFAQ